MASDTVADVAEFLVEWLPVVYAAALGVSLAYFVGYWRGGMAVIDGLRRGRGVDDLEEIDMARRPLTDEQLAECLKAGGHACPRCGDRDEIDAGEMEEREDGSNTMDLTCNGCNESWRLVYTLAKVERGDG